MTLVGGGNDTSGAKRQALVALARSQGHGNHQQGLGVLTEVVAHVNVPHTQRVVFGHSHRALVVRGEGHAHDLALVPLELHGFGGTLELKGVPGELELPDLDLAGEGGHGNKAGVIGQGQVMVSQAVGLQHCKLVAPGVEDLDVLLGGAGNQDAHAAQGGSRRHRAGGQHWLLAMHVGHLPQRLDVVPLRSLLGPIQCGDGVRDAPHDHKNIVRAFC
mmetsp:Transcript_5000/g.10802  ORF Transcript_5000/g.10802 Transcript_5000/m.10802 type:complete len:217 (-) Transcript_5000:675-1325(-)